MDVVGSAALVTQSEKSGVSLNMSIDYLRPGLAGEEIVVDAQVPSCSQQTMSSLGLSTVCTKNTDIFTAGAAQS